MMWRRILAATSIYFTKCSKLLCYNFKLEQYALYVPKSVTGSISLSKESFGRKCCSHLKKNYDKAEQMGRDFSPVCILALKFLISHLITAKVMLFCLAHVPWKAFQATISIPEGLENKRTWYGFLDFRINVLYWEIPQTMCKYFRSQCNSLPSNSTQLIF